MNYSLNPELNTKLKKEWEKIGLSKEIQESLFELMEIAAIALRLPWCIQAVNKTLTKRSYHQETFQ